MVSVCKDETLSYKRLELELSAGGALNVVARISPLHLGMMV